MDGFTAPFSRYAPAQVVMGEYCQTGEIDSIDKDLELAADWYAMAARRGDAQGQLYYGECLLVGEGADRNPGKGASWVRKAANQGAEIGVSKYISSSKMITERLTDLILNLSLTRFYEYMRKVFAASVGTARYNNRFERCTHD